MILAEDFDHLAQDPSGVVFERHLATLLVVGNDRRVVAREREAPPTVRVARVGDRRLRSCVRVRELRPNGFDLADVEKEWPCSRQNLGILTAGRHRCGHEVDGHFLVADLIVTQRWADPSDP